MDRAEQRRLQEIMGGLAAGDGAMVTTLAEEFDAPLRRVVTSIVFGFGRREVLVGEHGADDLVLTAALAIFDRARGWDPQGAPPWFWAERAIRSAVAAHVGHATVPFDPELVDRPELPFPDRAGLDGDARSVLDRLARVDDRALLWWNAVSAVATDRNRRVYFEYEIQKALGDRSPSPTVATEMGMSPDNVRQTASRVRRRLLRLIASDDRYASLRGLEWFAA
jgi:DNA-directed RNA polymerase specialized sigma24 family protein